jgi:predicted kinase
MISLDRIREEFRIGPGNETGKIVAEARERAKRLLRERQPFVWNATNLTRRIRIPLRDLFSRYGARIRLVYIEAPWQEILKRNAERSMSIPLPALEKMIRIWEMPRLDEAHRVEYFVPADSKLDRRNTE